MIKHFRQWFALVLLTMALVSCDWTPLVTDQAGLFTTDQIRQLELFHGLLLQDHDIDYRVTTVEGIPDINEYSARLYADQKVGKNSSGSYGLLLVIEDAGQQVRLEVGYGLEGYFPDAFVAYIENRQMLPFFAARRTSDGVLATTELIVDRAQKYSLGEGGTTEVWLDGSGGAGATARMGQHTLPPLDPNQPVQEAGQSPSATLDEYFSVMAARNMATDLELYTPQTRDMLKDWVMTAAQMDNVLASYRACQALPTRYDARQNLAVIRYPVAQRKCAPWFFRRKGELWQLDLTMMSHAVRFGRDNSWHFDLSANHPYEFAFDDWRFDRNGFPVE